MSNPKYSRSSENRQTVLPETLKGLQLQSEQHSQKEGEKLQNSAIKQTKPNILHKPKNLLDKDRGNLSRPKPKNNRFPVNPNRRDLSFPLNQLWQKYHQILKSNQAGPAIIAHGNTIDHNIVAVKEHRIQPSTIQRQKLSQVLQDKPKNIVRLLDIFMGPDSVHPVYEQLEVSLYQVRATSRQEIIEIDLAIIGKEVLQGLQYIHNQLGIAYGNLSVKSILLSFYTCDLKLANIAEAVLYSRSKSFTDDIRAVGTTLVDIKEPATHGRDPQSLQFDHEEELSELCRSFIKVTGKSSISDLLKQNLKNPSPVEQIAKKDARNRKAIFNDKSLRTIPPTQCFDAAIEDGTNTIFVVFGDELAVDEEVVVSVSRALGTEQGRQTKHHQDKPS